MVVVHPGTGRKVLFVNPNSCAGRVVGMAPRESKALLDFLFSHINSPQFHYRHRWTPGT